MIYYIDNLEFSHYGVKGMKWGIRHDYEPIGRKRSRGETALLKKYKKSYSTSKTIGQAKDQHRKNVTSIKNSGKKNVEKQMKLENAAYKKKLSSINNKDKAIAIGKKIAIAAGIAGVSFIAYKAVQSGVLNKSVTRSSFNMVSSFARRNNAVSFSDSFSGNAFFTKNVWNKKVWNSLAQHEKSAIKSYTGNYYSQMNKALRGIIKPDIHTSMLIQNCEAGLKKSRITQDVIAHRGIGSIDDVAKTLNVDAKILKDPSAVRALVNSQHTFVDKAFVSSGASVSDAWGGVKSHIYVPKGSQAMYVDPISTFKGEHELLIQRGSTFRLKDANFDSNGNLTDIFIEIIDQIK